MVERRYVVENYADCSPVGSPAAATVSAAYFTGTLPVFPDETDSARPVGDYIPLPCESTE